jgi:hypothetical protein
MIRTLKLKCFFRIQKLTSDTELPIFNCEDSVIFDKNERV